MFYQNDSVNSIFFTARNYDGVIFPEMLKDAPEHKSYIALTEVIISASRIAPMKNGWYHLTPEFDKEIDVLDTYGLMSASNDAEFFHIIYVVHHVYNVQSAAFISHDPIVVHAGMFMGNSEDKASEFSGMIYVNNSKSKLVLDTAFKDYNGEYLKNHPEINKEYIIFIKYRIANFNSLSIEDIASDFMAVSFGDGSYYESSLNDRTDRILYLDGIEDVLNGHMLSFISIKGYYDYDETEWFSGVDYLYNNMVLVE